GNGASRAGPANARTGVGPRVQKSLRRVFANRVVLLVVDNDIRPRPQSYAARAERRVKDILPSSGIDDVATFHEQRPFVRRVVPGQPLGRTSGKGSEHMAIL